MKRERYSIIYSSKTGNTKKLAEAIYNTLPQNKCDYYGTVDKIDDVLSNVIYIGFWTEKGNADHLTIDFLNKLKNKKIFLFGTAGYGESEKYFDEFIAEDTARILKLTKKVNDGEVRPERLVPVKQGIFRIKLGIIIARYSRGDDIACLRSDFVEIYEEWIISFFSPDAYNENLKMLSLAVLFEIEENLIALTKRKMKEKEVKDWLLLFLIGEEQPDLPLLFPDRFQMMKALVEEKETDKPRLLAKYLKANWYNEKCDCYEAHKSSQNIYYGYWSFEAGAIAKILNLDDSNLKDVPYYPYDLVHYKSNSM